MKETNSAFYHYISKIQFILLIAIAATLPLVALPKINSFLILLLTATWLIQWRGSFNKPLLLLFLMFFFLHVVGVFYSTNTHQAIFQLDKKMSFVLLPLVLANIQPIPTVRVYTVFISFVVGCFISSVVCLVYALHQFTLDPRSLHFFYYELVRPIDIHPIYLAMYTCFSCFILIYLYIVSAIPKTKLAKLLLFLGLAYFVIFLFLLSARAEILAFYLIVTVGLIVHGYQNKRVLRTLGIMVLLASLFVVLVFSNKVNRERFKEAINYNSEYTIDKQWGGRAERMLMWDCTLDLIKENPVIGVGPGDALDLLHECYKERNYVSLMYYENRFYNAHNQYFQCMLDLGILGLMLLLACLAYLTRVALKRRNPLFLSFVALFAMACVTESMLEVNKGIVFFTFFSSWFVHQPGCDKES
jgi:O-antigen ligase